MICSALLFGVAFRAAVASELIASVKNGSGEAFLRNHTNIPDIDAQDAKGNTALYWAAISSALTEVILLLERGASVDLGNEYLVTPLIAASENATIVGALLDACPNIGKRDVNKKKVSDHAKGKALLLLEQAEKPLIGAVQRNSTTGVNNVLNGKCTGFGDIEEKDSSGKTALMWATDESLTEIVRLLVQHKADFVTELLDSTRRGHLGLVEAFIAGGANIDEMEKGQNALIVAVKGNHSSIVQILLQKTTDVDQHFSDSNGNDYTAIALASREGYVEIVQLLDEACANLDVKDSSGRTALEIATDAKVKDLLRNAAWPLIMRIRATDATALNVRQVLQTNRCNRVDIDARDDSGVTALMVAAERNLPSIVQDLVQESKIDLTSVPDGKTALMKAAQVGPEVTKHLVDACANLDIKDTANMTALDYAAEDVKDLLAARKWPLIGAVRGEVLDIAALKEQEAKCPTMGAVLNVDAMDYTGMTALMVAAQNNHSAFAQLLELKPDLNARCLAANGCSSDISRTALMMAAARGFPEIVDLLIGECAHLNDLDDDGKTALQLAREADQLRVVKLLETAEWPLVSRIREAVTENSTIDLKKGEYLVKGCHKGAVDFDALEGGKVSALMVASQGNRSDIVQQLLDLGANVEVRAQDRCTALVMASKEGYHQVTEKLLAQGADINVSCGTEQQTVLMGAVIGAHTLVVRQLLDRCVVLDAMDATNKTALAHATHQLDELREADLVGVLDMGLQIKDMLTKARLPLIGAIQRQSFVGVENILSRKCKNADSYISQVDDTMSTALMWAIRADQTNTVDRLLDFGVQNINQVDQEKRSALLLAAQKNMTDVVRKLVEHDALVNAQDANGFTPLMYAAQVGNTAMVQALLAKNPDLELKNSDENTALHLAEEKNHTQIVEMLTVERTSVTSMNLTAEPITSQTLTTSKEFLAADPSPEAANDPNLALVGLLGLLVPIVGAVAFFHVPTRNCFKRLYYTVRPEML